MSSDVRLTRIDSLLEVTSSKRIHMSDYVKSGVPFYRSKEVIERSKGNKISTELFISRSQFELIENKFGSPRDGDILLTSVGTLGVPYLVQGDGDFYFKDGNLTWMRNFSNEINPRFLYYWLTSPLTQQRLDEVSIGSTQKALTISALKALKIPLPKRKVQDGIVEVLDAISDRIALLRETNATLEAIAQAMFKSWFVDFDPVHAKLQGRAPEGMSEATAALFPDSFDESELGLVPRGWKVGKVGDFAKQHKGSINPLQNPETLYEHFSLPAFDSQHMPVLELGTKIKSNKTSVPPDAVLLSKLNPHIPRIWLPVDVGSNAVCSTEFLVFVPAGGASKEFIYCAFTTPKFKELLCQLVTGTSNSHQRVKPEGVSSMSAVLPPLEMLEVFADVVKPMFERIGHNLGKAQTLATLRDTLLPRLISGQLRLPEAESALEEVPA